MRLVKRRKLPILSLPLSYTGQLFSKVLLQLLTTLFAMMHTKNGTQIAQLLC